MCCGNGDSAGSSAPSVLADASGRPADDEVYVVTYLNGVTEEVVGLDAVRARLLNPALRVEGAQTEADYPAGTVMLTGTYAPKR